MPGTAWALEVRPYGESERVLVPFVDCFGNTRASGVDFWIRFSSRIVLPPRTRFTLYPSWLLLSLPALQATRALAFGEIFQW